MRKLTPHEQNTLVAIHVHVGRLDAYRVLLQLWGEPAMMVEGLVISPALTVE